MHLLKESMRPTSINCRDFAIVKEDGERKFPRKYARENWCIYIPTRKQKVIYNAVGGVHGILLCCPNDYLYT